MVIRVAFSEKKSQEEEGRIISLKRPQMFSQLYLRISCCAVVKKDPDFRGLFLFMLHVYHTSAVVLLQVSVNRELNGVASICDLASL